MSEDAGVDKIFIKSGKKKRKVKKKKDIDVNAFTDSDPLKKFADEIINADNDPAKKVVTDYTAVKRSELIKASEDGYITAKVEYLKKCAGKTINKKYDEFMIKRKKAADMFLTDLVISQFSETLGGLDAIENPKTLADELKKK